MPRAKSVRARERGLKAEELPEAARKRLEYAEEWIAWSEDLERFVAGGPDFEAVRAAAQRAGVERPVMEWVPAVPIRPLFEPE